MLRQGLQSSPKGLHCFCPGQGNSYPGEDFYGWRADIEVGRQGPANHRTGADHRPRADAQDSSRTRHQHAVRPDERLFLNDHPPRSTSMRNHYGAHADLHVVLDLDALGPLVVEEDIVANENISAELHTSKAM